MRGRLGMAIVAAALAPLPARGEPLVADLSEHLIAIDSGFTGTEVLLYGAIDGKGDLVIVVRGPEERVVVRRKDRVAGVWMNRDSIAFDGVPAYYAIASSRPLEEIAQPALLALHRIGIDTIDASALGERPPEEVAPFWAAIIRNRVAEGIYQATPGKVGFLGERLFRTTLNFPANGPTATYGAEIFLIRDGEVVSAETTPLFISKTGFQAEINYAARTQPALYGLAAILIALAAGWAAAVAFRKT